MKRISMTYGQVLFDLNVAEKNIQQAESMFRENPELFKALENPTITKEEKAAVIDRLFSDDCDFCFYQWRTEQYFNFSVGDFIESDLIGERCEGRWLIKSISYNIEPDEDIMIDINVEFEPY